MEESDQTKRPPEQSMSTDDTTTSTIECNPAAETVAHLSKTIYWERIDTLAKRILPRLTNETGALQTVNYDVVLGHLKVVERISYDNPFSVLEHSEYELGPFDWERVDDNHPVHGLAEQTRRLVAGDVQQRLLEIVADGDETHVITDEHGRLFARSEIDSKELDR